MATKILIRGGKVIDGTGSAAQERDVLIVGPFVAQLLEAKSAPPEDAEVLDATGLYVCPGFIDIHNHSDVALFEDPGAKTALAQGVTTIVVGNCGFSPMPLPDNKADLAKKLLFHLVRPEKRWFWPSMSAYYSALTELPLAINVCCLVGHGALRLAVLDKPSDTPSQRELRQMASLLQNCLDEGAFGLSTGLEYSPCSFAKQPEFEALASVLGDRLFACHLRNEGERIIEALEEMFEVQRKTNIKLQVSHLKLAESQMWGKSAQILEHIRSQASRYDVMADQYPYTFYHSNLGSIVPPEFGDGTSFDFLRDRRQREKLCEVISEGKPDRGLGWDRIYVSGLGRPEFDGKSIDFIARAKGKNPFDEFCDILLEFGGGVVVMGFVMNEGDVEAFMQDDLTMVGSDGEIVPEKPRHRPHPRSLGTFPRVLGMYVREKGLLSPERAVMKMTSRPAARLNLKNRGTLASGYYADITCFDPQTVRDTATFEAPMSRPEGIVHVLVNGVPVVKNSQFTNRSPGGPLKPET